MKVLSRKEINTKLWDDCIDKSVNSQIFAYSWYLDACCPNWSAIVKDNYEAVFPFAGKNKFGINYLYQPFFTRHFGVYTTLDYNQTQLGEFINSIPGKYKYWDFDLNNFHTEIPGDIKSSEKVYQTLQLKDEYSFIRKRYNENLARNLKKAEKDQLSINHNYDPESVISNFKYHQRNKQLGFEENDFKTLSVITKALQERSKLICMSVKNTLAEDLAGAVFMHSNKRIVYLKGFSSEAGKKSGAMHYLFDKLIQENAGKELLLDFGGSNVESVARFYKSFGGKDSVYLHLQYNRLPTILRLLKR